MPLQRLDHVNIRTSNLDAMIDWYGRALGMAPGPRPPFSFPGAWLYVGESPVVHLIGVDDEPAGVEPKLEHFALTATDLEGFLSNLRDAGIDYRAARVPGFGTLQINLFDADGNHIHVDFSPEEADAAGL